MDGLKAAGLSALLGTMALALVLAVALPAVAAERCTGEQVRASWYGPGFHGRTTANGERYNQHGLSAAHKTLPFGTRLRVSYRGKSVAVRVNDRGPYIKGRSLDLSRGAAERIGLIQPGHARVCMEVV